MLSVTALKMFWKVSWRYIYIYIMEVELKTEYYCLTCGRTVNLDLCTIPPLSLNFSVSTHNCIKNHLKIGQVYIERNLFDYAVSFTNRGMITSRGYAILQCCDVFLISVQSTLNKSLQKTTLNIKMSEFRKTSARCQADLQYIRKLLGVFIIIIIIIIITILISGFFLCNYRLETMVLISIQA